MNPQDAPLQAILTLPGAVALSPFRVEKLLAGLPAALSGNLEFDSRFVHFVAIRAALDDAERVLLERLLTYGKQAKGEAKGELRLVLPRLGTISPWSSKATDIAAIARCRRWSASSAAWRITSRQKRQAAGAAAQAVLPLLARPHDRIGPRPHGRSEIFQHDAPQPLTTVARAGKAAPRWKRPTATWAWRSRPTRSITWWRTSRASGATRPTSN